MNPFHCRNSHFASRVILEREGVGTVAAIRSQRLVAEQKKSQGDRTRYNMLNWSRFKREGHWPTLASAFLYFDFSFMVWTLLGVLGAQIAAPESLNLSPQQKGFMVAVPILSGAILRIALGLLVDRIGAKNTGIFAQIIVIFGLAMAWLVGLKNYE